MAQWWSFCRTRKATECGLLAMRGSEPSWRLPNQHPHPPPRTKSALWRTERRRLPEGITGRRASTTGGGRWTLGIPATVRIGSVSLSRHRRHQRVGEIREKTLCVAVLLRLHRTPQQCHGKLRNTHRPLVIEIIRETPRVVRLTYRYQAEVLLLLQSKTVKALESSGSTVLSLWIPLRKWARKGQIMAGAIATRVTVPS